MISLLKRTYTNGTIYISILILIASLLRLYKLGTIPNGFTNDELGYVYNAYSIAKTGHNIYGQLLPWQTTIVVPFLPVPTYLIAPFVGIFGLNTFTARLPNALLGIGEVLLVFLMVKKLFNHTPAAFLGGLALAISPWHLQLTRSSYDAVVGVFFYLLALYIAISNIKKKHLTIWPMACLFLGVYSYRAMNIIFFPISMIIFWYGSFHFMKKKKDLLLYAGSIAAITASFFLLSSSTGKNYTQELFTSSDSPFNMEVAQKEVDMQINTSSDPLVISRIFANKPLYFIRRFRENYLGFFSTQYLFTAGEAQPIYALWWRGMLYDMELPLIVAGLVWLFTCNKKAAWLVVFGMLIGPLPSAVSGPTYGSRAFFTLPFLMITVGGGIVYCWEKAQKIPRAAVRYTLLTIFIFIYLFHIVSYLDQYYSRYPNYSAEPWFRSMKDVSLYIGKIKNNYDRVLVSRAQLFELLQYAFWNTLDPIIIQQTLRNQSATDKQLRLDNITFMWECLNEGTDDPAQFLENDTIYFTRGCHPKTEPQDTIKSFTGTHREGEIIWKVYWPSNSPQ